jgi:hypothetical protein
MVRKIVKHLTLDQHEYLKTPAQVKEEQAHKIKDAQVREGDVQSGDLAQTSRTASATEVTQKNRTPEKNAVVETSRTEPRVPRFQAVKNLWNEGREFFMWDRPASVSEAIPAPKAAPKVTPKATTEATPKAAPKTASKAAPKADTAPPSAPAPATQPPAKSLGKTAREFFVWDRSVPVSKTAPKDALKAASETAPKAAPKANAAPPPAPAPKATPATPQSPAMKGMWESAREFFVWDRSVPESKTILKEAPKAASGTTPKEALKTVPKGSPKAATKSVSEGDTATPIATPAPGLLVPAALPAAPEPPAVEGRWKTAREFFVWDLSTIIPNAALIATSKVTPEAAPKPTPKPDLKTTPKATSQTIPKVTPKATPQITSKTARKASVESTLKPDLEATLKATPQTTSKAAPKASVESTSKPDPETTPKATPQIISKVTPKATAQTTSKVTPSPKATLQTTSRTAPKASIESTSKPNSEATPKATPQTTSKATPKATLQTTSKTALEASVESTSKPNLEATPKATLQTTSNVTPKATPKTTPKSTQDATSKANLEATLKVTSKTTLKSTSEVTSKATSKAASKAASKATPDVTLEVTPEVTPEATSKADAKTTTKGTLEATSKLAPKGVPKDTLKDDAEDAKGSRKTERDFSVWDNSVSAYGATLEEEAPKAVPEVGAVTSDPEAENHAANPKESALMIDVKHTAWRNSVFMFGAIPPAAVPGDGTASLDPHMTEHAAKLKESLEKMDLSPFVWEDSGLMIKTTPETVPREGLSSDPHTTEPAAKQKASVEIMGKEESETSKEVSNLKESISTSMSAVITKWQQTSSVDASPQFEEDEVTSDTEALNGKEDTKVGAVVTQQTFPIDASPTFEEDKTEPSNLLKVFKFSELRAEQDSEMKEKEALHEEESKSVIATPQNFDKEDPPPRKKRTRLESRKEFRRLMAENEEDSDTAQKEVFHEEESKSIVDTQQMSENHHPLITNIMHPEPFSEEEFYKLMVEDGEDPKTADTNIQHKTDIADASASASRSAVNTHTNKRSQSVRALRTAKRVELRELMDKDERDTKLEKDILHQTKSANTSASKSFVVNGPASSKRDLETLAERQWRLAGRLIDGNMTKTDKDDGNKTENADATVVTEQTSNKQDPAVPTGPQFFLERYIHEPYDRTTNNGLPLSEEVAYTENKAIVVDKKDFADKSDPARESKSDKKAKNANDIEPTKVPGETEVVKNVPTVTITNTTSAPPADNNQANDDDVARITEALIRIPERIPATTEYANPTDDDQLQASNKINTIARARRTREIMSYIDTHFPGTRKLSTYQRRLNQFSIKKHISRNVRKEAKGLSVDWLNTYEFIKWTRLGSISDDANAEAGSDAIADVAAQESQSELQHESKNQAGPKSKSNSAVGVCSEQAPGGDAGHSHKEFGSWIDDHILDQAPSRDKSSERDARV